MKINTSKILAPLMILAAIVFGTSTMAMAQGNSWNNRWHNNHSYNSYNQQYPYYQTKQSIGVRIQNQKQRIAEGIRDRSLTYREASTLRNRLASLEGELSLPSRNGYMTVAQYNHFQHELDRISDFIYKAKHNASNANYRRYYR